MRSNTHLRTALAAFMIIATARVCFAVACGETITDDEVLTADLNCATTPALTIGAGGSLDLNAFKVTCNGTNVGIHMTADDTSVSNGSVGNCGQYGIRLFGSGHKVTGMYVFNTPYGIYSSNPSGTNGIKIQDSAVIDAVAGITLAAGGSSISGVSVIASSTGVSVEGDGNKVKDVTISDTTFSGLFIYDDDTKVSNVRIGSAGRGIFTSSHSANNKYSNVHSLDYTVDGLHVEGPGNKLLASTAISSSSGATGIYVVSATGSTVSKCTTLSGNAGIRSSGTGNAISKNRVFGSGGTGLFAETSNGEISGNVALGNAIIDLNDNTLGCDNVWSKNIGKKGQSCIE